jgi:hypothetical protein
LKLSVGRLIDRPTLCSEANIASPDPVKASGSDLSPVAETSPSSPPGSVTRSRTLPSGTRAGRSQEVGQERARVLRKQRRATSSQPKPSETPVPVEPT